MHMRPALHGNGATHRGALRKGKEKNGQCAAIPKCQDYAHDDGLKPHQWQEKCFMQATFHTYSRPYVHVSGDK